jgi:hypothetical protein
MLLPTSAHKFGEDFCKCSTALKLMKSDQSYLVYTFEINRLTYSFFESQGECLSRIYNLPNKNSVVYLFFLRKKTFAHRTLKIKTEIKLFE